MPTEAWQVMLVNNAAHHASFKDIAEISDAERQFTFAVKIRALFYLTKATVPHVKPSARIINTASINADKSNAALQGIPLSCLR